MRGRTIHTMITVATTATLLLATGCAGTRQAAWWGQRELRIEIAGQEGLGITGEYELDGQAKDISGRIPMEIIARGHDLRFSLKKTGESGAMLVNIYANGRKTASGCTPVPGNGWVEGAVKAGRWGLMDSWLKVHPTEW